MTRPFTSLISVFAVSDLEKALAWYRTWLGEPDVVPMEGVAEYQVAEGAWLQLSNDDASLAGKGMMVLGVEDAKSYRQELIDAGVAVGELMDYEVVLTFDIADPDGNLISFAQEL